jgi:hypothetical protein
MIIEHEVTLRRGSIEKNTQNISSFKNKKQGLFFPPGRKKFEPSLS